MECLQITASVLLRQPKVGFRFSIEKVAFSLLSGHKTPYVNYLGKEPWGDMDCIHAFNWSSRSSMGPLPRVHLLNAVPIMYCCFACKRDQNTGSGATAVF